MTNPIQSISSLPKLSQVSSPQSVKQNDGVSFKELLKDSISHVNQMQVDAGHVVERLAASAEVNRTEVLTSVQKADLALSTLLQIQNRLVAAYDEVRNIRI